MKKFLALTAVVVMALSLIGCSAVSTDPDSSFNSANYTKTDGDVRYEQGYYADMYHKFRRIDIFAQEEFDYTVRVTQNDGYTPVAATGDLFRDYNSYLAASGDPNNFEYFNYLSNKSYTYTFLNADQCAEVYDAYYNMLSDETYADLQDVVGLDVSGQPIELYFQSYDTSEPADILIMNNQPGTNSITVAFAPYYDGEFPVAQSSKVMDNANIAGMSVIGFVSLVCGSVLAVAVIIFIVFAVIKSAAKRKARKNS